VSELRSRGVGGLRPAKTLKHGRHRVKQAAFEAIRRHVTPFLAPARARKKLIFTSCRRELPDSPRKPGEIL